MAKIGTLKIAMIHGWAGFHGQWKELSAKLSGFGELFYLGTDYTNSQSNNYSGTHAEFDIVIAHSFGFRWMMENKIQTSSTILLAPLLAFSEESLQYRSTQRMIKLLPNSKLAVLDQFYENGKWKDSRSYQIETAKMESELLIEDLMMMCSNPENQPKMDYFDHLFYAESDSIVPNVWGTTYHENNVVAVPTNSHFLFLDAQVQDSIVSIVAEYLKD